MIGWIDVGMPLHQEIEHYFIIALDWNETGYQVAKWNGKEVLLC